MRGATSGYFPLCIAAHISIHAPHAGRDLQYIAESLPADKFQSTRPMRGATVIEGLGVDAVDISIHAPHAGRDSRGLTAPRPIRTYFNPRAPCGARPVTHDMTAEAVNISIHAPHAGRDGMNPHVIRADVPISIHAPHAGRDSKSIQNYFKHFCDKRQFLDNFTQNTAFQSVLPLADRQKLLYLRCEPLRKFLRAFASHYKIIGSSGR